MYFLLFIIAIIFAITAQAKVQSAFREASQQPNRRGYTGAQVAQQILMLSGINDVAVERVAGNLTDHYDPKHRVLRLSEGVYDSNSLAALGVAAHESGHAIQDDTGYAWLQLRTAMVPIASFASRLAMPLILLGILFYGAGSRSFLMTDIGLVLFAVSVLFTLITLPVEFDASKRAIAVLQDNSFLSPDEIGPAKKVLDAAAMTYVASAAVALVNFMRMAAIFGRRRG